MRILLVYLTPPSSHWPRGRSRSRWVPTGVAYLGAVLRRAGHSVLVHIREEQLIKNGFDWDDANARLRSLIDDFKPKILGMSVLTPSVPEATHIAKMARQICGRDLMIVAGGPHPTAVPELMFRDCPELDAVVIGEGEHTIVEVAEKGIDPDVAGLVFHRDGSFLRTAKRNPPADLDSLGPPAYELFDMNFYTFPTRWMIRWLPFSVTNVRTSRGCVNRCRFCAGHLVSGLGVRYHSIDFVIDQIKHVVKRYGVEGIHFEDDSLGADRTRLLELCDALRINGLDRRIKWDCCLRVDQTDAELLKAMKSAGCIQVEYGFESGSDATLKQLGKNATPQLNRRAVALTRQAGLRIFADIMVGLPGETERDFKATMEFLRWARPEIISAMILAPLPGTAIYNALDEQTRDALRWEDFSYSDPPGFDLNLTAMSSRKFSKMYRHFRKYFIHPQVTWAFLRDTPRNQHKLKFEFIRKLVKFCLQHPIHAIRAPW